jgi:hypothetical protein
MKFCHKNRAVGYCNNGNCPEFVKGTFLLNYGEHYYCVACRQEGEIIKEDVEILNQDLDVFKAVRVRFDYNHFEQEYKGEVEVSIDQLAEGATYVLITPLVKTQQRAFKMAESILSSLVRLTNLVAAPEVQEVLSFDEDFETFKKRCDKLSTKWAEKEKTIYG